MSTGLVIKVDTRNAEKALAAVGRTMQPDVLLKLIGQAHLYWLNLNFRQHGAEKRWPPLRPNTLANPARGGGGAQPLRNTGRLAMSFTAFGIRLRGQNSVSVGTEVPYATFHQYGTRPYTITVKPPGRPSRTNPNRPGALAFWAVDGLVFRRKVKHPGLPVRALLPSMGLAKRLAVQTTEAAVAQVTKNAPR